MNIRPAGPEDVEQIASIFAESGVGGWPQDAVHGELGRELSAIWVVTIDEAVAGCAIQRQAIDEAELLAVAVDASFRRRGLARALVNAAFDHAARAGMRRVLLEVRSANHAAIGLYASCGFHPISLRRAYYRAPEDDAVVMERVELTSSMTGCGRYGNTLTASSQ